MENRKYAIIGASGKVGSKVAEKLLNNGQSVRAIARHEDKLSSLAQKGAEIYAGSIDDLDFLVKAFNGVDGVFSIIASDMNSPDLEKAQDQLGQTTIEAIKKAGVKNLLFISSVGGHDTENTGIVKGLARQELRLKRELPEVNILILRPSYFIENTLWHIGMIKNMNMIGSAVKAEVKFPIVATNDIAEIASKALLNLSFKGHTTMAVLGARDYSYREITSIIGKAIGNENLNYVEFSYDDMRNSLIEMMGMSTSVAEGMVGLQKAVNEGFLNYETRDQATTTPTTVEQFVEEVFVPAFQMEYSMNA